MDTDPQHDPQPSGGEHSRQSGDAGGSAGPAAGFFDSLRRSGLVRAEDRWIGGVSAGLAQRLDVDALLVRGVFVVLTFFGGLGLLLYGLAWALLPEASDGRIHVQEALRGRFDAALAGALVMVIIGLTRPGLWWTGFWWADAWGVLGLLITTAVVVAVLLWVIPRARGADGEADDGAHHGHSDAPGQSGAPEPHPAPSPSATTTSGEREATTTWPAGDAASTPARGAAGRQAGHQTRPSGGATTRSGAAGVSPGVASGPPSRAPSSSAAVKTRDEHRRPVVYAVLGLALLALAATYIAARVLGWDGSWWLLGGGVVLTVLGLGIIINGARGRRAGGLGGWSVLVALVVLPLTLALGIAPQVRDAVSLAPQNLGDTYWAPDSATALTDGYAHSAGRLHADLSAIPPATTTGEPVEISLAAGQLLVDVPADLDVDVAVQGTGSLRVERPGTWFSQSPQVHADTGVALLREVTLRTTDDAGPADIDLALAIGAGEIVIRQVPPAESRTGATVPDRPADEPSDNQVGDPAGQPADQPADESQEG